MKTRDLFQYIFGSVLVVSILILLLVVFTTELPEGNKEVAYLVIGSLVAKFGDVIAYFYNSSKGSADKTEIISKLPPINDSGC